MRLPARSLPLIAVVAAVMVTGVLIGQRAPPRRPPDAERLGPARVRSSIVERHARQFDRELPERPAGSQEEFAAASYILGHLQTAGYTTRLESVPVANTIRSTDVLALPPGGDEPGVLVTVAFDTSESRGGGGAAIGLFLELARALHATSPRHDVGFAALGAEHGSRFGDHLGSRRLAQLLMDQAREPIVISIDDAGSSHVEVWADSLRGVGLGDAADAARPLPEDDVFSAAGFRHVIVSGPPDRLGPLLLGALSS